MGMHDSREEIDKQQRLHVLRNMKKVFKVADLRDLDSRVSIGEISYSRMVEILNEMAYEVYNEESCVAPPVSGQSEERACEQVYDLLRKLKEGNMCSVAGDELIDEFLKS